MLLVAHVDVVEQWALPRQKGAADLQTLSVPILAFLLLLRRIKRHVLFHLHDEPYLRTVAKVAHSEVRHFLDKRLPSQL